MGMTCAEKALARRAGLDEAVPGQIVIVEPNHLLPHDNTAAIVGKIGVEVILDAAAGTITVAGNEFSFPILTPDILAIREAGGLLPWTRAELEK